MGLDSVEILMDVEDAFGITIPVQAVEKIVTLADLYETVWHLVNSKLTHACISSTFFYRIRASLLQEFNHSKNDITLTSRMDSLIPRKDRRRVYQYWQESLKLELPKLVLPPSIKKSLFFANRILFGGGLVLSVLLFWRYEFSAWIFLLPVLGIGSIRLLEKLLDPWRVVFNEESLQLFIQQVLLLNYAGFVATEGITRLEMIKIINAIIVKITGIKLDELQSHQRIGHDLGID